MTSKEKTERQLRSEVVRKMKSIGTYDIAFSHTIDMLAKIMFDYQEATKQFEKSGGNMIITYTNKSGATNPVKNPFYQAIEKLRSDMVLYSRELGLTPTGFKKLKPGDKIEPKQTSALEKALSGFG